jgi:hypothetical protein
MQRTTQNRAELNRAEHKNEGGATKKACEIISTPIEVHVMVATFATGHNLALHTYHCSIP